MAGRADYLLKIRCRDVEHLDTILREEINSFPGVVRSNSTIAMKSIKQARGVMECANHTGPGGVARRDGHGR